MSEFAKSITATEADIDELGHVNNAVWVQWIQDVAVSHWYALAPQDYADRYIWVVIRHEIDYLRAALPGETVTGRTWVPDPPRGARFDRHMEFTGEDGKVRIRAKTTWAIIDKATGRPLRVPPEMAALFLGLEEDPHPNLLPRAGEGATSTFPFEPSPACGRGQGEGLLLPLEFPIACTMAALVPA